MKFELEEMVKKNLAGHSNTSFCSRSDVGMSECRRLLECFASSKDLRKSSCFERIPAQLANRTEFI